jgi:hypothetical protein
VLAHLAPYYESQELLDGLDRSVPLYIDLRPDAIAPQNKPIVKIVVPLFLCADDRGSAVSPIFGPTNYAGCAGAGGGERGPVGAVVLGVEDEGRRAYRAKRIYQRIRCSAYRQRAICCRRALCCYDI